MLIGGTLVSVITILPLPWRVRLAWARLLHFAVKRAKRKIPYIFEFKETENIMYGLGIQSQGDYASIEKLESTLRQADVQNLPIEKLGRIIECTKTQSREDLSKIDTNKEDVSVPFSGGKDSTLVAALMCKHFKKVHLLTFTHSFLFDEDKTIVNVNKLKNMFGEDKIEHVFINIEYLFKEIYDSNYINDFKEYKTYLAACFCGACRLSMQTHTIIYNMENNIRFTRDGTNKMGFDPAQHEWVIPLIKNFYSEYSIDYELPIYNVNRPDLELLEIGINSEKPQIFYRNQPECGGGHFHNIYLRCYYLPMYGRGAHEKLSINWTKHKMEFCRKYIQNYFNNKTMNNIDIYITI